MESSGDFSLKMEMTNSELVNNITTHQKILQRWSEKFTLTQTEQFKNIKFAMGLVFGIYNEDTPNDIRGAFNEKGPNGEKAYSGMVIQDVKFSNEGCTLKRFFIKEHQFWSTFFGIDIF